MGGGKKQGGAVTVQERRRGKNMVVVIEGGRRRKRVTQQQQHGDREKPEEKEEAEEEEMKIWAGLPSELLMRVAACLPALKVFQLQTVCKSWRILPKFASEIGASSRESAWFVMLRPARTIVHWQYLIAFSPTSRRWFQFPPQLHSVYPWHFHAMSSAGGLMCAQPEMDGTLVVFNPLTKIAKTVPLPAWSSEIQFDSAMVANPATASYHVIRFGRRDREYYDARPFRLMHVYDSRSGSWTHKPDYPVNFTGNLLDADLFQVDKLEGTLLAYNAEHDAWSKVEVPRPSCTTEDGGAALKLVYQTVVKCKRRLLLIAGLELLLSARHLEVKKAFLGFGVWELHFIGEGIGRWVELSRTPREYWEGQFLCTGDGYTPQDHINFSVADENLICMTGMERDTNFDEKSSWSPLVYDLALDSWQFLPCNAEQVDCLGLLSFQPRWDARV